MRRSAPALAIAALGVLAPAGATPSNPGRPGREAPENAIVVDGTSRFVLPGLADMHVHIDEDDLALFLARARWATTSTPTAFPTSWRGSPGRQRR